MLAHLDSEDGETVGFALALITATWMVGEHLLDEEEHALHAHIRAICKLLPICREALDEPVLH